MNQANAWIESLQLEPHPEGGWYREVYRSPERIAAQGLPPRCDGDRAFSTAIYFLLKDGEFSALHRIQQDEVWHHYDGASLRIDVIDETGGHAPIALGTNVEAGERPLAVVTAGCLFGASLESGGTHALVGCTVAPGFEFADFHMPSRERLLEQYPQHRGVVQALTRA